MTTIAVRSYTKKKEKKSNKDIAEKEIPQFDTFLIFDTETTTDQYQNLLFGSYKIVNEKWSDEDGLFYNDEFLADKEIERLKRYSEKYDIPLLRKQEFVDEILYPHLLKGTLCIGFNLPFDLSRLEIKNSYARGSFNGGFSLTLSKKLIFPRIKIRHLDTTKSFIELGQIYGVEEKFRGYFCDVKTLVCALSTIRNPTLAKSTKHFGIKREKKVRDKHGRITENYINYNRNDVEATYALFLKLEQELKKFSLELPINQVYSAASIGKAFLKELNIKPFLKQNQDFSPKILGNLMSAFYGGRCELRIRKTPLYCAVLDFFSSYPTLFTLLGLWDYLIAEKIECENDTENVQNLLDNITLKDLQNKELWKSFCVLVEICPENDILPIRSRFDEKSQAYNIAINQVTSEIPIYYALPDLIASKLLSGKTPKIKKAIRFKAIGKQKSLKEKTLFGISINPNKDNLIRLLAEKRQQLKQNPEKQSAEKALKILLNALTYGIFIEMNEQEIEEELEVYSNTSFIVNDKHYEKEGEYFNPIISITIVAGARLLLAMAESLLAKYKVVPAYFDTDSVVVPAYLAEDVEEFFMPLNPYSFQTSIFKIQKKGLWFYGICSKRYVLYKKEGEKIIIEDCKLHGLGHLKNPFGINRDWQKMFWIDILRVYYELSNIDETMEKYRTSYAISQLSVSGYNVHKRFKAMNKGKPIHEQIKPFSFMLVGISNDKDFKPISPYSRNTQKVVYEEFIDYKTGKRMKGEEYWKQMDDLFLDFINKKEFKFEGDIGELKRKRIIVTKVIPIGKEAKNLEFTGTLDNPDYLIYESQEQLREKLLKLTAKEIKKIGISKTTWFYIM